MAVAIFGFVWVLLGSLTTSVLAVYRERLTTRREQDARGTHSMSGTGKPHVTRSSGTAFSPCRAPSQT